jgi:hypothetical protein
MRLKRGEMVAGEGAHLVVLGILHGFFEHPDIPLMLVH